MRQRFRPFRGRAMARRPGEEGAFSVGPRERRLLGWIVAIVLVIGIAVVVGVLGGNGDGAPVDPGQSTPPSAGAPLPITFGTTLDAATGEVPTEARTERFTDGDTFAYAIEGAAGATPPTVYVEVERIGGGAAEVVQAAIPDGEQPVPSGRPSVAFSVPAADLLAVFGPGEYRMRIFSDPAADPLAEGTFTLVSEVAAPSTEASATP